MTSTELMEQATDSRSAVDERTGGSQSDGELLQLVTFVVADEEFAIPILTVQEINRMMEITRVPESPDCVDGVINLRGRIIPVIDLRKRFGLGASERSNDSRIVVVEVNEGVIGFTVDRVNEVLRVSADIVDPPPPMVCNHDGADYVQGVGKLDDRLLLMLDVNRLFNADEMSRIQETVQEAAA